MRIGPPKIFLGLLLVFPVLTGCKTSAPINRLAIIRENPTLDQWISPDARVEPIADGFGEVSAIAWSSHNRYMIIADRENDVLWKYADGRGISAYYKPAGRPVGIEYDSYDRLVVHQETGVVRLDKSGQTHPLDPATPRRPYLLDSHGYQWTIIEGVATLLDADGGVMGYLRIPDPIVSLCWGDDGSAIYLSAKNTVYRVRTSLSRAENK
jgi:hypothetical protein